MTNSNKNIIQDNFGKAAANYASAAIHSLGEDLQWMVEVADLKGTEHVLDVGTGAGHAAFAMAPYVATVEGIDITPQMLQQSEAGALERKLDNVKFSLGDVESIPRDDATYDIVVSRWCAHHYQSVQKAVAEIARVLKPNGQFILIDSCVPPQARVDTIINTLEFLRDVGHVRNYQIQEWLAFTESVGLHGEVLNEWALRLDGENWVQRIHTPTIHVQAIQALLSSLDAETRQTLSVTDGENWGFNLPAFMMRAIKR